MLRIPILAIVLALCAPAHADVGAMLVVHASRFDGLGEGGAGALLELSRRRGSLEYFGDLVTAVVGGKRDGEDLGAGATATVLGGLRWTARSFEADGAQLQLAFEAFAGGEHLRFADEQVTRPVVGAGSGWHVRFDRVTVHVMLRLYAARDFAEHDTVACRGTCPAGSRAPSYGFMGGMGASW